MAQTGVLVPDGDGTTLQLTPISGTHFDEVANGVSTPTDSTFLQHTGNSTATDFLDFEDMPGDFDVAIDVVGRMRTVLTGIVDDTVTMDFDIFNAAESAVIENLAALAGNHSITNTTGSAQANTDNAAAWDGYKMRLQVNRNNSGMPDSIQADFVEVEIDIQYTPTSGPGPEVQAIAAIPVGEPMVMGAKHEVVAY